MISMIRKRISDVRSLWLLPLGIFFAGSAILLGVNVCPVEIAFFLNWFVIAPILVFVTISLLAKINARRTAKVLSAAAAIGILWTMAVFLFLYSRKDPFAFRETVKWLASSRKYKQEVLAQSTARRDLRHIEWDGSGFAGAENVSYLVFDPTDSLSAKSSDNQSLRFNDRSCNVRAIHRLESHWYAVLFYTDESWDDCK